MEIFARVGQLFTSSVKVRPKRETLLRESFRPVRILKQLLRSFPYHTGPALHLLTISDEILAGPHPLKQDARRFGPQQGLNTVRLLTQNARGVFLVHGFTHTTG